MPRKTAPKAAGKSSKAMSRCAHRPTNIETSMIVLSQIAVAIFTTFRIVMSTHEVGWLAVAMAFQVVTGWYYFVMVRRRAPRGK